MAISSYSRSGVLIALPATATFSPLDCWFRLWKDTANNKAAIKIGSALQALAGSMQSRGRAAVPTLLAASCAGCLRDR